MTASWSAVPRLVIDGRPLDPALQANLARVEVDERRGLPTMVTVVLRDAGRDVLDKAGVAIGTPLEVQAGPLGESATEVIAQVEVVTLEATYSDRASTVTVRAYDASHRLHRFRRTRSWTDVTDGDVVRRVAEDAGLQVGTVDDPGVVHIHLAQLDQTDWDFLAARARDAGRVLRVAGARLELVPPEQAGAAPEPGRLSSQRAGQLVLGSTVESLHARVTSAELPARVEVRGWATDTKAPVVASAPVTATGIDIGAVPADLARATGSAVLMVADRAMGDQGEADATATALAEVAGATFAGARAVCVGDPRLRVGSAVSIGLAGALFSGRWTVTSARHTFDAGGYRTTVDLGTSPEPGPGRRERAGRASLEGPVPAVVTDVADASGHARVRVGLPWLSEEYVSDWVRVVLPGAGAGRGLLALPEVDDEVLLAFEQGDVRRPYVLGGIYNGADAPPLDAGDVDDTAGEVRLRGWVSRLGHQVVLDDGTAEPGIRLVTGKAGVRIALDDATGALTVQAEGDIEVSCDAAVSVRGRTVQVTGDQEVSIKAPNVSVEADGTLTLRGGVVKIN